MLNRTGIKKETYGSDNQILFAVEHQVSVGVVVDKSAGVTVGKKKIVKAGTPLTGNLEARGTAFTEASAGSSGAKSNAVGVLLHDVDVTIDNANGTIVLFGFVNTNRLDETTQGKVTQYVKEALPMIKFVAC